MRSRARRRPLGLAALLGLAVAGCNAIFGLSEGAPRTLPATGSSTAGAGGLGGASGGGGTATAAAGSGGTATGAAGSAPTACELWGANVCGPTEKCSVVDEATGETGCVEAGQRPAWAYCQSDGECAARTFCDHASHVCKPVCQNANDCPPGGNCFSPAAGAGGTIPLPLQICAAYCDPRNAQSCNQQFGPTNCVLLAGGGFDCYAAGSRGAYESCAGWLDCGPGLGCYTIMSTWCRPWCNVGQTQCAWPFDCLAHTPPVYYESTELGSCG